MVEEDEKLWKAIGRLMKTRDVLNECEQQAVQDVREIEGAEESLAQAELDAAAKERVAKAVHAAKARSLRMDFSPSVCVAVTHTEDQRLQKEDDAAAQIYETAMRAAVAVKKTNPNHAPLKAAAAKAKASAKQAANVAKKARKASQEASFALVHSKLDAVQTFQKINWKKLGHSPRRPHATHRLMILRANGLRSGDLIGSDPYVAILVGHVYEGCTKVAKSTKNILKERKARWDGHVQELELALDAPDDLAESPRSTLSDGGQDEPGECMQLVVGDWDRGKDDLLGVATFDVASLADGLEHIVALDSPNPGKLTVQLERILSQSPPSSPV